MLVALVFWLLDGIVDVLQAHMYCQTVAIVVNQIFVVAILDLMSLGRRIHMDHHWKFGTDILVHVADPIFWDKALALLLYPGFSGT